MSKHCCTSTHAAGEPCLIHDVCTECGSCNPDVRGKICTLYDYDSLNLDGEKYIDCDNRFHGDK